MQLQFPAELTHRSGVAVELRKMLVPIIGSKATFEEVAMMLRELHCLRFYEQMLCYYDVVKFHTLDRCSESVQEKSKSNRKQTKLTSNLQTRKATIRLVEFGSFGDKATYAGAVPSSMTLLLIFRWLFELYLPERLRKGSSFP